MDPVRQGVSAQRALTDASLGAERATADAETAGAAAMALALAQGDALIERDRVLADARLLKFREDADHVIARERLAPRRDSTIAHERDAADEAKQVEREVADDLLARERRRADDAVQAERREHEPDRSRLVARRQVTDDQLGTERSGADADVAALGETRSALALAEREQTQRRDLLAMVTHDLRSPLSVIMMNAQCIVESTTEGPSRAAAQEAVVAAARMDRLLTDLLDVARIESGTLRIVKRPHDVGALVENVLQSYRPLFAARGITFTADVPASAVVASFDHDRIVQVLSNLLSNAMKFTAPEGKVALHVEKGDGQIELTLRDSGSGIHPDALPHVFKRFWQIDSEARRGLGLGLYICQIIIEAHDGHIGVESDYGKGATVRFTLPGDRSGGDDPLQKSAA